ncbi:excinuclease ABC subunit UvrB [Candidatus Dojkabacteria bacterium]|nr:excinuclease ABC subunit UvrB [Candidatus Dojkabacteria bacterium]
MSQFQIKSKFKPSGDQPQAIEFLTNGVNAGIKHQTLLGITGSGKTFTMANVIQNTGKPTLILSHNKTLAAQLFSEFQEFFPHNHVEYFVSYYDYYQPEAYVPRRDLFIEKEVEINEDIERYRSSATQSLLTQKDVIVIATVSCIYGLGNPEDYMSLSRTIQVGMHYERNKLLRHLADMQYERKNTDFYQGSYRVRGDVVDIYIASEDKGLRLEYFGDQIEEIKLFNPLTGEVYGRPSEITIFPAKQYVTAYDSLKSAIPKIRADLELEVKAFQKRGLIIEAERLRQRVNYDLEMLQETGYVSGIENYSRYIENRPIGSPPSTLIDYFSDDWLLIVDESHMSLPQVRGMYNGDRARKENLVHHGFRMNAAFDNRPLKFEEFLKRINQVVYVSATPSEYELSLSRDFIFTDGNKPSSNTTILPELINSRKNNIVEQIIRPTGLIDPNIDIRPSEPKFLDQLQTYLIENKYEGMKFHPKNFDLKNIDKVLPQVDDLVIELKENIKNGQRVLVTTLTKRMAENLSKYLSELHIKNAYLHSEIDTIERVEILRDLRLGKYDVIVGINLLREGLDLPEVSLVVIIDADKEGFLRSDTSLIQTIGRAARHHDGRVIMYADKVTQSMKRAIDITLTRREKQRQYNLDNNITPITVQKDIKSQLERVEREEAEKSVSEQNLLKRAETFPAMDKKKRKAFLSELKLQMDIFADMLEFEKAAEIRDLLLTLESK